MTNSLATPVIVQRQAVAQIGDFEVTWHAASGFFEVWSPAARIGIFLHEHRALECAKSHASR